MPSPFGNLQGLKPGQLSALERLYKRRFPQNCVWSQEQAREIALLTAAIGRQIGLLIDRSGKVRMVITGSATSIFIPELPRLAEAGKILRGWRLVHTHLSDKLLDQEDLLDMLGLRLDSLSVLTVNGQGEPGVWQIATLNPAGRCEKKDYSPYIISPPLPWHQNEWELGAVTAALEEEFEKRLQPGRDAQTHEKALLVSVSNEPTKIQERNLEELAELAASAGLKVTGSIVQRTNRMDARHILGKGKLEELEIMALDGGSDLLVFDGELSASQLNNLAKQTERKVMDRTQLILDIFAAHATTRAGKLQVELAQLAYIQPRLAGQNKAMDRLAGGPGGRGPGETRLEMDRRKIRSRMAFLKKELSQIRKQRSFSRSRRMRNGIPLAALIGYTNAGKSSLLNKMTASQVKVADQLFATLDPVTRRIRVPYGEEIIISDTVGFIRNLPDELMEAFRGTLEELESASVLLHVVDSSNHEYANQIEAVENILEELGYTNLPRLLVFNKIDKLSSEELENIKSNWPDAIFLSSFSGAGLEDLLKKLEWQMGMISTTSDKDRILL